MKAKILNLLLLLTFILTLAAPLTGVVIHKLASTAFLLLCLLHTFRYRSALNRKRYALLGLIVLAFVSGIFGMIYEETAWILAGHKVLSIGVVFALAIHTYIFRKRMR